MSRLLADYTRKAREILVANDLGGSTRPAPGLYPHQWNWDSGFIAIGWSHLDTGRACREIETLFAAQWSNGMVPQIVFDPEALGHYFPEPDFWQTARSPHAPRGKLTSGITMPPVHAIAVERIRNNARRPGSVQPFLERIYPKLLALHRYLHTDRDPEGGGLAYIRHPWESGIDNSPTWDGPLGRIEVDPRTLPVYERRDLDHGVDPRTRPTDEDYDRYVFLVDLFRRYAYDETAIRRACPFLVEDPLFNSVLARADEALADLAPLVGADPAEPRAWAEKTRRAIREKLWHPKHRIFDAHDRVADTRIEVDTAAGFLPLFAGAATPEQAEALYRRLDSAAFCRLHQGNCFTVPNYDTGGDAFDRSNYWRGPVWININWMLAEGLARYGYTLKADSLRKDLLQLPIRFGFHEYFDSFDGTGYGADRFSWTAALFIDLVHEHYPEKTAAGLARRLQGWCSPPCVLNRPQTRCPRTGAPPPKLAARLMEDMRDLRDKFYDTERGRVDYVRLARSPAYDRYRERSRLLVRFDPGTLTDREHRLAFWINLYNTLVVDGIVALGIRSSVKEVPEFFTRVRYDIGGRLYSLDQVEHGILRGNARSWFHPIRPFGSRNPRRPFVIMPIDPRIHFALVCGSRSCAPIEFYDPERIDAQLETATRGFVNSSEVLVLPEENKLLLSEIFRWYASDFGGRSGTLAFLRRHLADDRARDFVTARENTLSVEYLPYDWNLNQ